MAYVLATVGTKTLDPHRGAAGSIGTQRRDQATQDQLNVREELLLAWITSVCAQHVPDHASPEESYQPWYIHYLLLSFFMGFAPYDHCHLSRRL